MVSSEILFRLKTSYTLKCLLTTNFQFRALSGKKTQLVTSLNTNGKKKTVSTMYYKVLRVFILKANRKSIGSSKKRNRHFKITLRLRDWHYAMFLCDNLEILNDFNTLTLKQIFWKMKIFFK